MNVVFSERAIVALLVETKEKINTETGGLFLGRYTDETFYVVETIDPGPNSVFEVAYFEYDVNYVNHLINKISRLYEPQLDLIGLWHRHPGSLDVFSGTDDITNKKYAELNKYGAISGLVNIDPDFRLTMYKVKLPFEYERIEYEIGEIPSSICELKKSNNEISKISGIGNINYIERKDFYGLFGIKKAKQYGVVREKLKEFFDYIAEDIEYFSEKKLDMHMQITEKKIAVLRDREYLRINFVKCNEELYVCFDDMFCKYEKGLLKRITRYA